MMLILKEFCLFGLLENNIKQHKKTSSELWGWLFLFIVQQLSYFHFASGCWYQIYENMTSNQDRSNALTLVIGIHCKLQLFSSLSSPADKFFISSSFHFRPILGMSLRSPSWRWWREEKQAGSVTRPAERGKCQYLANIHTSVMFWRSIEKRDWSSSCVFLRTSPVVKIQQQPNGKPTIHTMVALGTTNQVMWVQLVLCSRDHQQSGVEVTG